MQTFVFTDHMVSKFLNFDLRGMKLTLTYGKLGTAGRVLIREFPTEEEALKEYERLVTEKLAKGYTETTPKGPA